MAADTVSLPEIDIPQQEIAFIDASISGYQTLLDNIKPGVEVVLIDGTHDGMAQIAAALAGRSDIAAVHLFTHGGPGTLELGTAHLSLANMDDYAADLAVVRSAMAPGADLLVYGCDVAAGDAGQAFINALSSATGTDVAASDDATGSALLHGDWVLEARTGPIEAAVALTAAGQQAFGGTLSVSSENFDALGLIDAPGTTQMSAGNWKFTSDTSTDMAVANSGELPVYLNTDDPGNPNDRAVALNYNNLPGVTNYAMGSADGSNFMLQSFNIGNSSWASPDVTISAYSDGVQVVGPELVDLSTSDSTGNISYVMATNDGIGRYGTLTFNSAYGNIDEIRFSFSGDADMQIDDINVSAVAADTTAPVFSTATINGSTLVMTYTDANALDATHIPSLASFAVSAGGAAATVTGVAVDATTKTVTLTLASPVGYGQAVTVAYTDPTAGNDANAIQDAAGNDAASLGATSVTNLTPDTTAPVFASAAVDGATLVMSYTEATTLDAAHAPAAGSFTVMAGGSAVAVSSVAVDAAAKTVTLTLASAVLNGQAVTVAYSDPTAGNDANAIQDAAGNDAATLSATSATNNTLDTTPPSVSGTISVPADGAYHAGQTLSFTVTFDENVTVSGNDSTLDLTIGSSAHSAAFASSTANSITYSYTVQPGDLDGNGITIGAISLGSTTIRDAAGNDASLVLAGHTPSTAGILVDTVAPAIAGNVSVPAGGTYAAGQHLDFTVTFDENVIVNGSDSTLALTVGSSAHTADFLSSSGSTVTYRYTVQAGDADLDGIAVGAIALGSTTIRDAAGNDADLGLAGHLPSTAGVLVDAVAPSVTGNLGVPTDGLYHAGQTLSFTLTFDENVTVSGSDSTLGLTIGSTARSAAFASSSGNAVTYTYTVQAGDMDANGIAVGAIALGSSTIRDASGNDASLALAGHVPSTAGVLVDAVAPAVTGNVGVPAGGVYHAGQTLSFTVTFDENVTVTGSDSTLGLTIGASARSAAFASSTANSITYTYTVQPGDVDANGITVGALSLGSSAIRDGAGNDASLTLTGHMPSTAGILVDTIAPTVAGNVSAPANSTYAAGQHLDFTVTFDENVVVNGSDSTLALTIGASTHSADFLSSSGNAVTYRYSIQAGDVDADGISVGAISLGSTTIRDAAGNDADLSLAGHLPSTAGVLVDATVPAVAGSIGVPADGAYVAGQTLSFTVTFDENVTVTGTDSTLDLTIGGAARSAAFASSSGNTVTYTYTVQAGDVDADGIAVSALSLGSSTIRDAAGNDASLALAGHVPSTASVLVDAVAPSVTGNVGVPAGGVYHAGQTLSFTVTFDENVTVSGSDSALGLTIGGSAHNAAFASSTANSITYTYTVQPGDADADGITVGAISLGSTTIRDAAGNDAGLALGGHTPSTTGILVDTIAPAVTGSVGAPASATYVAGQNLDFTVSFDENVIVTGSDSTLALTVGSSARTADFLSSSGNTVTYRYTVQAGDVDADGISVGAVSLGASTIRDAAGNDADLSLAGHLPSTAGVVVDATVPTITGAIGVPVDATYVAGQTLNFTVTFNENVTVTGTDSTLDLTIGGAARSAAFASASGNTLTYTYTVQPGDADADGIAVGAIALGASTIRDAAGNDASLALAGHVPATTGVLVDTTGPSFVGATVNGATLVMNYADTGMLDAAHAPGAADFAVAAGGTPVAVTAVAVNGAAHTVTLTLASAVANGAAVTVAYGDPSTANDLNAIQDAAGNDAGTLAAVAVANNTPAPVVQPPVDVGTVDGVAVQVGTVTNSDGSVSQALTIPIVTAARVEQVGNNTVADIPLVKGTDGASLLTAQVPVGVGLQATGFSQPKSAGDSLTDLIREIQAHTESGSHDQSALSGGGSAFVGGLQSDTPLIVQTIVPTAANGSVSTTDHLAINGTPATAGTPDTALVIDARALPAGSTIELNNVEFAALIGAVSVMGGAGEQKVWGDSASQTIYLGPGDDILHGGGGNDIVGSAGGDDQIFGDDGDDVVFGGTGNDTIDGGAGHDTLQLAGSNRSDYSMRVVDGKLVVTQLHDGVDGTDVVTNVEALRFTNATNDTSAYGTTGRVVEALTGGQASLETLDAMTSAAHDGATLSQIARTLYGASGDAGMSDGAFIQALYQNAFQRAVDAGGLTYWSAKLDAGVERADVALAVANSAEMLAKAPADTDFNATDVATLVRMYSALFDRAPDEAGLNYWISAHENGMAMADIADEFVAGAESAGQYSGMDDAQFINALYLSAMHRQAATDEVKWWVDSLASGHVDRGDVLLAFADSTEKVALIGTISTSIHTL